MHGKHMANMPPSTQIGRLLPRRRLWAVRVVLDADRHLRIAHCVMVVMMVVVVMVRVTPPLTPIARRAANVARTRRSGY